MSDFMAVHTLEHLQCIVVMGVFLVRCSYFSPFILMLTMRFL